MFEKEINELRAALKTMIELQAKTVARLDDIVDLMQLQDEEENAEEPKLTETPKL